MLIVGKLLPLRFKRVYSCFVCIELFEVFGGGIARVGIERLHGFLDIIHVLHEGYEEVFTVCTRRIVYARHTVVDFAHFLGQRGFKGRAYIAFGVFGKLVRLLRREMVYFVRQPLPYIEYGSRALAVFRNNSRHTV